MDIKEWQKKVYNISKDKGWYDDDVPKSTDVERHMLIVSEVAEATEEVRDGKPPIYGNFNPRHMDSHCRDENQIKTDLKFMKDLNLKPEGEAIELADAVIRIMDYFESKGWDLEEAMRIKSDYNETRPYRHGGKKI